MSYLYFVVQNEDKQRVSQINRANVACNLLALVKSDDSDLLAAKASKSFPVYVAFGGRSVGQGPCVFVIVFIVGRRLILCKPVYRLQKTIMLIQY